MSFEHERLPRSVELAANIVAGHVRRTETAPERFADLLMAAYQGIKALEQVDRAPQAAGAAVQRAATTRPKLVSSASTAQAEPEAAQLPPLGDEAATEEAATEIEEEVVEVAPPKRSVKDLQQTSTKKDKAEGYVRNGRQTVFADRIICLDDNKEVTFLRRHLRSRGIDENDYLYRHNLPRDYPLTTPDYVARKKAAAAKSGFGTALRPAREGSKAAAAPAPATRAKGKKTAAAAEVPAAVVAAAPKARRGAQAPRRPGTLRPTF